MDVQAVAARSLNASGQSAPNGFAKNHVVQTVQAIAAALSANNSGNFDVFVLKVSSQIQQYKSASNPGFKKFIAVIPDVMSGIEWTIEDKQVINEIVSAKIAQHNGRMFGQINQAELKHFLVK